jgi:hypothetical protein
MTLSRCTLARAFFLVGDFWDFFRMLVVIDDNIVVLLMIDDYRISIN